MAEKNQFVAFDTILFSFSLISTQVLWKIIRIYEKMKEPDYI